MQEVDLLKDSVLARRSSWPHVPISKYLNYMLLTYGDEPKCYDEVCHVNDASK